jgi:hypothetical protein
MGSKKTTTAAGLPALKIGGRVRRTDNGVSGRIVWANGVSVKITWDDGEQVTWRRDSLAERPIEILGEDEDQATAPTAPAEPTEPSGEKQERETEAPEATATEPASPASEAEASTETPSATGEPVQGQPKAAAAASEPAQAAGKPKRRRKDAAEPQEKKLSALDAAARVLAETGAPMGCKELIGAMAGKGYWMSPGGKTPSATLFSAIAREIATKGDLARFTKAGPGRFGPRRA